MKAARLAVLAGVAGLLVLTVRAADDAKAPARTGGNFEVAVTKDIAYVDGKDADPERHKLDLYLPRGQKDFPVLVYIHGGGWQKGSKQSFERQATLLARNGIGVAAINYRLTPQVKHPAHIQDVAKAFAWTYRNIGNQGGKTDEMFVGGHSAGGHLAALLATDGRYLEAEKLSLANIKGAIPISGVYTIRPGKLSGPFGSDETVCRNASPMSHVGGKHPPFLVLYADKDGPGFDKMADDFAQALQKNKIEATSRKINDRTHGSIVGNMVNQDDPTMQLVLGFIAGHSGLKLTPRK
jgi:acetyl esterase/lipase